MIEILRMVFYPRKHGFSADERGGTGLVTKIFQDKHRVLEEWNIS